MLYWITQGRDHNLQSNTLWISVPDQFETVSEQRTSRCFVLKSSKCACSWRNTWEELDGGCQHITGGGSTKSLKEWIELRTMPDQLIRPGHIYEQAITPSGPRPIENYRLYGETLGSVECQRFQLMVVWSTEMRPKWSISISSTQIEHFYPRRAEKESSARRTEAKAMSNLQWIRNARWMHQRRRGKIITYWS